MTRSRRELSAQDLKLWRHVTRNVSAFRALASTEIAAPPEALPLPQKLPPLAPPPHQSRSPVSGPQPLLALGRTADMDRRQARRLKRGELPVDSRLDLHGLTLERAHAALSTFIRGAHARGARLVVVVTGKGDPARGGGRIRNEAPHWLNQPDLRSLVVAVTEARGRDGGGGALYVLLKRQRPQE